MAVSTRVVSIDNASGSLTDYSAVIVGATGDFGGKSIATQDLTGPAATRPRKKVTGYAELKNFTLTFEYTSAIKTAFYNGAETSNPRTCKLLLDTGDYFQVEANIVDVKLNVETGENGLTTLDVEFEPTDSETIA